MSYNIKYPYYCKSSEGICVILNDKEALSVQGGGTGTPGASVALVKYISRAKVLKIFKYSKPITELEFQEGMQKRISRFLGQISGAKITQSNINLLPNTLKAGGND